MAKKGELEFPLSSVQCIAGTLSIELTHHLPTAKARLINVRLISMAMTGFFYTFKRPRTSPMMGMLKYDPIGRLARRSCSKTSIDQVHSS
ncbi:Disintegrin and metalloproteinase domain-containing protein B [Purpureocillium lavendulum]|uniref:Large ribosomal subunit protein bL33m n=1 Tax=Purpureocillium lavendulum TaxID=1247861 RepID=A0AB34FUK3_9HYPO|nr:Disintegrin and metalloproteinase domain-containing protein B [Purpureocillium lavendulum]